MAASSSSSSSAGAVVPGVPLPNVLVCGTPGTGKSTVSAALGERLGFHVVGVGELIKEKGFHSGRDEEFDTLIFDEAAADLLLDELEPTLARGGQIVDYHSVDFFPERWFDLVLVLRTDNTRLYDRLAARGYAPKKLEENLSAEIMCVVAEEARASYRAEIVQEVESNTAEDIDAIVGRAAAWLHEWRRTHPAAAAAPAAAAGGGASAGDAAAAAVAHAGR